MNVKSSMRTGFSLAEIMIAIAIIGMIMAVIVPGYNRYREKAMRTATIQSLKALKTGIDEFSEAMDGKYPEKLQDLVTKPSWLEAELAGKWESYLGVKKIPLDEWKRAFVYKRLDDPNAEHAYELYSLGAKEGKNKGKIDVWEL
jgi:type II secretion system protein G